MRNDDELRIVPPLDIDTIGSLGKRPARSSGDLSLICMSQANCYLLNGIRYDNVRMQRQSLCAVALMRPPVAAGSVSDVRDIGGMQSAPHSNERYIDSIRMSEKVPPSSRLSDTASRRAGNRIQGNAVPRRDLESVLDRLLQGNEVCPLCGAIHRSQKQMP